MYGIIRHARSILRQAYFNSPRCACCTLFLLIASHARLACETISEFTSIMLDWLIPKSVNVVKEWTMHSIISSSVHDLVISVSHWCKLLIRYGPKPTVKDHLVVLLHCCLHRPISMYSLRISARTVWTLFLLSLICLDVAFNILQIHENGQKT